MTAIPTAQIQPIPEYDAEVSLDGDRMDRISRVVEQMVTLELRVGDLERQLAEAKKKRDYFAEKIVPEIMGDCERFRTRSGFDVEVKQQVFASFPQDPERQKEAFEYLEKTGNDGVIKRQYTISYGRDTGQWTRLLERTIWPSREDAQSWKAMRDFVVDMIKLTPTDEEGAERRRQLQELLDTQWTQAIPRFPRIAENASVDRKDTIHHSTLVKLISDELKAGRPIPLEAFGAVVKPIAKAK